MTINDDRDLPNDGDATNQQPPPDEGGLIKNPEEWVSGDDPMTPAQAAYIDTLARQAGEEPPEDLNKAEASQKIDELRSKAGLD